MAISRKKKESIVASVGEDLQKSSVVFFIDFTGLKTVAANQLRKKLKEFGGSYRTVKKTLAALAFKNAGKEIGEDIISQSGPLGVITAPGSEIEIAKTIYQFGRANDTMKILGGIMGSEALSAESVVRLAKIPSREVLVGQLVGVLASPIRRFMFALNGNTQKLVMTLSAIQKGRS